ncbi:hypothetical protein AB6848_11215 [Serratia proteamaculans]|uniref:hypothetical protein n=1 Tax=Serratia proteamaculans TaxID=28151 RepID=UPI0039BDDF45
MDDLKAVADYWRKVRSGELQAAGQNEIDVTVWTAEGAIKRISELESSVLVPGALRCAKCQFQLTKTIICMKSGTTSAGNNKTEPCPNGCGPLWPVTWKQWAKEMDEQAGRYFDELKAAEAKLATPVQLPEGLAQKIKVTGYYEALNEMMDCVRAAGFTVEGDE